MTIEKQKTVSKIRSCYETVKKAVNECLPKNYATVSKIEIVVSLQEMLNKSAQRLRNTVV